MTIIISQQKKDFAIYNITAKQYDQVRFNGQAGIWSHRRQMEVLRLLLPDLQGKRVLEIGAGTGRATLYLAQKGARVLATDISPKMLAVARQRLSGTSFQNKIEFQQLNIFDLNIDLSGYDYIVALNVLSRLSNPENAIINIAKKMSSECRFLFSFNCLSSVLFPFALIVNFREKSLSRAVTSRWYTPAQIKRFCQAAGIDVLTWQGNHYVPNPRILFFTLPLFQLLESIISKKFPKWSPSVFAVTRKISHYEDVRTMALAEQDVATGKPSRIGF